MAEAPKHPAITRYLAAVHACRAACGHASYPGSPWLLAHALREHDRIASCEMQPEEAAQLKANFARDERVAVHARDGYAAIKALLPAKLIKPGCEEFKFSRGIVRVGPSR